MPRTAVVDSRSVYVTNTSDVEAIRFEEHDGVDHMVVPLVALVEGVVWSGNSPVPELALATEFGKIPDGWNGRPVTLGHPRRNGQFVSASQTPKIFEEETLGFLFNTRIDGKKLKTEAWINMDRVNAASEEVQKEIKRLESGETVEISTGLFCVRQEQTGRFNGEEYDGVWSNVVPDHLAILKEGEIGACSVEDGCGAPRLNFRYNSSGAKGCSCKGECDPCKDKDKDVVVGARPKVSLASFMSKFSGAFQFNGNAELSDVDTHAALYAALVKEDQDAWFGIVAIFSESFVYYDWLSGGLVKRSYNVQQDGVIVLGTSKVQVRPVTDFVPVIVETKKDEDLKMSKASKVAALIANKATQFSEDDRSWLETMSEEQLDKLNPVEEVKEPVQETEDKEVQEPVKDPVQDEPQTNKTKTMEEYIAEAPAEIREVLNSGVALHREAKDRLVKTIVSNSRNAYTEKELRAMDMNNLEKVAKLASSTDFRGQGGGKDSVSVTTNSDAIPPAPKIFASK